MYIVLKNTAGSNTLTRFLIRVISTLKAIILFFRKRSIEAACFQPFPFFIIKLLTYAEVDMECYRTVDVILTDAKRRSI